jgi:hypothetical protein
VANVSGVIALVFDFDDTLAPDSTSKLLASRGIDPTPFWDEAASLVSKQGYDPTHAYLRLLLDNIGDGKRLGRLTNRDLNEFGQSLDDDFYPGIPEFFDDLRARVSQVRGLSIEFFIVSGGLEDLLRGSSIVQQYFSGVYGCLLGGDTPDGQLRYIRRAVTFSEKTRFLFEINKGLNDADTVTNPYLVNKQVEPDNRPIPWENMLYVGNGLTDIPCFSLVEYMKGRAFGILHTERAQQMGESRIADMLGPRRARSLNEPFYRETDGLGTILRTQIASVIADIQYRRTRS